MNIIRDIKVSCDIGDVAIGGQIASFAQKSLNREYRGEDYDLVVNSLEVATHAAIRSIRSHLKLEVTIHLEANKVVHVLIHYPIVAEEIEPELSKFGEESTDFLPHEVIEAEVVEEVAEELLSHHRRYWPIQSKNDKVPRWGKTPEGRRSWFRRTRK
jgi:hypothetical protein